MPSLTESTSTSLLARVRERESDAWARLARLYAPLVYRWARQCGLQSSDAADVVQETFLAVASHIQRFDKSGESGAFRGWLWTISRNQIRLFFRRLARQPQSTGGSDGWRALDQCPDMLDQERAPVEDEARRGLVRRALNLIRPDFQEQTWEAFERVAVQGEPAVEVAAALGMTPAAVRQAKYRVLCRLHEELEQR